MGRAFQGLKVKSFTDNEPAVRKGESDPHEMVFIDILTTTGAVTLTAHVEHNGYYGGFALVISEKETP